MTVRDGWLVEQLPRVMASDPVLHELVTAFEQVHDTVRERVDAIEYQVDTGLASPEMLQFLGSWLGLPRLAGAAPFFALAGGLLLWTIVRAGGLRALAVAAAVAAAVIGAFALWPRTPGGDAAYLRVVRPAVEAGASITR